MFYNITKYIKLRPGSFQVKQPLEYNTLLAQQQRFKSIIFYMPVQYLSQIWLSAPWE